MFLDPILTREQTQKVASKFKVKLKDENYSDSADAEVLDLAHEPEPVPYAKLAPRQYRKLHDFYTSIQSDRAVRLPKRKPGFSYSSGSEPYLPFVDKGKNGDPFTSMDSDDDEFPSLSEMAPGSLHHGQDTDLFGPLDVHEEDFASPSLPGSSLASLEAEMAELADDAMIDDLHAEIDSNFANGVFDFDAFNGTPQKPISSPPGKEVLKSEATVTPIQKDSLKRDRSATPEMQHAKQRRVAKDEPVSQSTQPAVPDWVNDFDSDLINDLKGFVDFVD